MPFCEHLFPTGQCWVAWKMCTEVGGMNDHCTIYARSEGEKLKEHLANRDEYIKLLDEEIRETRPPQLQKNPSLRPFLPPDE